MCFATLLHFTHTHVGSTQSKKANTTGHRLLQARRPCQLAWWANGVANVLSFATPFAPHVAGGLWGCCLDCSVPHAYARLKMHCCCRF